MPSHDSILGASPLMDPRFVVPFSTPLQSTASHSPSPTAAKLSLPCTLDFVLDSAAIDFVFRDADVIRTFPRPLSIDGAGETMTMICTSTSSLPCLASPSGAVTGLYVPSYRRNLLSLPALQCLVAAAPPPLAAAVAAPATASVASGMSPPLVSPAATAAAPDAATRTTALPSPSAAVTAPAVAAGCTNHSGGADSRGAERGGANTGDAEPGAADSGGGGVGGTGAGGARGSGAEGAGAEGTAAGGARRIGAGGTGSGGTGARGTGAGGTGAGGTGGSTAEESVQPVKEGPPWFLCYKKRDRWTPKNRHQDGGARRSQKIGVKVVADSSDNNPKSNGGAKKKKERNAGQFIHIGEQGEQRDAYAKVGAELHPLDYNAALIPAY
ncbi:unnamed protein product [Closterium sp. NIES-53]